MIFSKHNRSFWDKRKIFLTTFGVYCGITISLLYAWTTGMNSPILESGDFPGFYAPAKIMHQGDKNRLYDLNYQREVEGYYWSDFKESFYIFAYPPYVARLLVPLAWFPPGIAKLCFVMFHFMGALLALVLLKHVFKEFFTIEHQVLYLLFPPLLTSIFGAQNSAFTLLLYAFYLYGILRSDRIGDSICGIAAGVMLFKPQYGVFFIFFLLCSRNLFAFFTAILIAISFYLVAANDFGFFWLPFWWESASAFGDNNFIINSHQMISITGFLYSVGQFLRCSVETLQFLKLFGYLVSFLIIVGFYSRVIKHYWLKKKQEKMNIGLGFLSFLGIVSVITSPQTLYYDMTICLVSLAIFFRLRSDREVTLYLLFCALLQLLFLFRSNETISLYFLSIVLAVSCYYLNSSAQKKLRNSPLE